jgi:hypothetical protein
MNVIRIKENLPMQVLYTVANPPPPKPKPHPKLKYEAEQRRLDSNKRAWFAAMAWGMWTTGK